MLLTTISSDIPVTAATIIKGILRILIPIIIGNPKINDKKALPETSSIYFPSQSFHMNINIIRQIIPFISIF
jgi:hypothetical protein